MIKEQAGVLLEEKKLQLSKHKLSLQQLSINTKGKHMLPQSARKLNPSPIYQYIFYIKKTIKLLYI